MYKEFKNKFSSNITKVVSNIDQKECEQLCNNDKHCKAYTIKNAGLCYIAQTSEARKIYGFSTYLKQ